MISVSLQKKCFGSFSNGFKKDANGPYNRFFVCVSVKGLAAHCAMKYFSRDFLGFEEPQLAAQSNGFPDGKLGLCWISRADFVVIELE